MLKIAIFQLALFGVNCYVVWCDRTREAVVVDPGISEPDELSALKDFIKRENLKVIDVINTHLHIDHAIGNSVVADEFDAPVKAHRDDLFLGERMGEQARQFGIADDADSAAVTEYIQEGDVIKVGDGKLNVIHVPGHSPGSVALYDPDDKFLITGDALFQGSIGRTDLPGGSYGQLIDSLRSKVLTLPDETKVYPGHGNPTTIGREKLSNPFLR